MAFLLLLLFLWGVKVSIVLLGMKESSSVDSVTDWFVTTVLGLPRILYYSKETLGQKFLAKVSLHKGCVLLHSDTKLLKIIGVMLLLHSCYGLRRNLHLL